MDDEQVGPRRAQPCAQVDRRLALKSLSGNADDEYLGLGITDTIITRVSRIHQLTVRPTSAVLKYGDRDTDALTAARELHADAVIDGTVQRVGDRLRLNLNLFRVEDGQSLWSESFNISFNDMFTVQDQVSHRVAERLQLKLIPQEVKARPSSPEAFDDYLRGKYYLYRGGRSGNDTAIEMLERAVTKDPNFAQAYAALAQAYRVRFFSFAPHEKQWQEKAFVAVEKALALDPELADAYVARATLLWTRANNFPHEQSARECQRALALNPNLDEAHRQLTVIYNHVGLLDKAIEESKKAFDPSSSALGGGALLYQGNYQQALNSGKELSTPFNHYQKAFALTHLGRRDEASAIIEDSLKKFPEDQGGALYSMRAMLFALAGDERRAGENINTALEQGKDFGHFHHATYTIAAAYAIMNKREQALKWVQFTADNGFPCYPLFEHDPDLNNLRQDPRFVAFMSRLKAQWEEYKTTFA
ncbi:MAG TPA: hypothetical protein VEW46_10390 [Pyrinomonadaceae bacterium]|nr:hypothetical protein [Pyrinomonadaceae bacterium]